ncbi:hypothetical protein [Merismopedia glauca]|uniref:Uncharacterized protein n=1 Tax=Merismopedia glauca CCAP 1448/3 TaxID=1296344 RepID=A0A2T1C9G2_9CYAN|nr:hypothetical protein [Merismopedia glauca]PSB04787.1 hypothetical protein C7B64_02175 [Merismopedia glauca CCAP 1448/3]
MTKLPLLSGLGVSLGLLFLVTQAAPSLANPVRVYYPINRYQPYQGYTNWIYGSPIPAPMPVNPITGSAVNSQSYNGYIIRQPLNRSYRRINNSILVNPTVINSQVSNSVLVNPVVVDTDSDLPVYLRRSEGYRNQYWHY